MIGSKYSPARMELNGMVYVHILTI